MTTYSFTSDRIVTAAATNAVNITDFDYVYVAQGVHVSASGNAGSGIKGASNDRVTVSGDVFADFIGIYFSGATGNNNVLVDTHGSVVAQSYGIYEEGANNRLTNAGTVAGFYGVTFAGGNATIHNTGLIQGENYAIILGGDATTTNRLVNTGDILSTSTAVSAGLAADSVINKGLIVGQMFLGGGNDVVDSRGGVVQGKVDLSDGNDTAYGGDAADDINGGNNDDLIRGKQDDDRLDGGNGKDRLIGGLGEDKFVFTAALGPTNIDTIGDFIHGEDTIVLDALVFAALGPSVGKAEFVAKASGHAATNASQHIIYDKAKGTLWYDSDGNGSGAAVKFAQLGTTADHPTNLTYLDFAII